MLLFFAAQRHPKMVENKVSVAVGGAAPNFALPARSGRLVSLADFRGVTNVLLYFYPKDDTPGCAKEACSLRDGWKALAARDVEVLGVSRDDIASHNAFAAKYQLPFELLTDASHQVHATYGAWGDSPWGVGPLRKSFLIGKDGIVRRIFHKVDTEHHAEEVLKAMESSVPPGSQPPAPAPTPAAPTPVAEAVEKAAQAVQAAVTEVAKDAKKKVEQAAEVVAKKAASARKAVKKVAKKVARKVAKKKATLGKKKAARRAAPKRKAAKKVARRVAKRKAARKPAKKATKSRARKKR
jgi:peroxiredoxin Q/BCP